MSPLASRLTGVVLLLSGALLTGSCGKSERGLDGASAGDSGSGRAGSGGGGRGGGASAGVGGGAGRGVNGAEGGSGSDINEVGVWNEAEWDDSVWGP
jgi:hypothetical protein